MKLSRVVVGLGLAAVGFVAGTVFGYQVLAKPFLWMGAIGRSFTASQYAVTQYREASYAEAREALEAYILYLDSSKPVDDPCIAGEEPWLGSRGLRFDKTLAWVRLAMLHESNGKPAEAEEAWRRADDLVAQGSWKDRSRQHFRDLITSMDRMHPTPSVPRTSKSGGV